MASDKEQLILEENTMKSEWSTYSAAERLFFIGCCGLLVGVSALFTAFTMVTIGGCSQLLFPILLASAHVGIVLYTLGSIVEIINTRSDQAEPIRRAISVFFWFIHVASFPVAVVTAYQILLGSNDDDLEAQYCNRGNWAASKAFTCYFSIGLVYTVFYFCRRRQDRVGCEKTLDV